MSRLEEVKRNLAISQKLHKTDARFLEALAVAFILKEVEIERLTKELLTKEPTK